MQRMLMIGDCAMILMVMQLYTFDDDGCHWRLYNIQQLDGVIACKSESV